MPMSGMHAAQMLDSGMADMGAHCAGSSDMDGQHKATTHSGGCFHCDEPAQYVKGATADMAPVNPVLVALSVLPEMPSLMAWDEVTTFHTPTGPPRSSSLLYTTTQRIRV